MQTSNIAFLTKSRTVHARNKRAKKDEIKQIIFDDDARREFLTGFRKRKLQKTEAKKNKRIERERKERLETRREQRHMLAEQAAKNAAEVEAAYGGRVKGIDDGDDDESWQGISREDQGKDKEEEYEGEEQLATVTIIEEFDPAELIHGPGPEDPSIPQSIPSDRNQERSSPTTLGAHSSPGLTSKKIHYETKTARFAERKKQHNRMSEKAARSRGKLGKGKKRSKAGRSKSR